MLFHVIHDAEGGYDLHFVDKPDQLRGRATGKEEDTPKQRQKTKHINAESNLGPY